MSHHTEPGVFAAGLHSRFGGGASFAQVGFYNDLNSSVGFISYIFMFMFIYDIFLFRLKGLCDNVDSGPEPFHDHELCFSLRAPNQTVSELDGADWQCRVWLMDWRFYWTNL